MASLFDVDINSRRVDPRLLDTDSKSVYRDPKFTALVNSSDREIIIVVSDRLNNTSPLIIGRLPAMLFILDTPESCRVLVRADFGSISTLLLSTWNPSDEYVRTVMLNERFKTLMSMNDDVLAADVDDLGVDPRRIRKFPAILLLLDTTSSWVLLASADDNSIIAAVKSKSATERRVNTLRDELSRLGRPDNLLKDAGEIFHLPVELVREIILNTHDIARLSELQKISTTYAKVLNDPSVLEQLADWWMKNGGERIDVRSWAMWMWPLKDKPQTFREFRKWVVNNYYTSLCYQEYEGDRGTCFRQMVMANDTETWNETRGTMSREEIAKMIRKVSPELLIKYGNRDIALYVLENRLEMGRSVYGDVNIPYMFTIAFGSADDLRRLLTDRPVQPEWWGHGRVPYATAVQNVKNELYKFLLVRGNYDRDITQILLDILANRPEDSRAYMTIETTYVSQGPTSSRWIPELIADLESGYYPYYSTLPSIQAFKNGHDPTNYWLWGSRRYQEPLTLANYLRDLMGMSKR